MLDFLFGFLLAGQAGVIDAGLAEELTNVFTANISAVLPIAITILGIMLGIRAIPKLINRFF